MSLIARFLACAAAVLGLATAAAFAWDRSDEAASQHQARAQSDWPAPSALASCARGTGALGAHGCRND